MSRCGRWHRRGSHHGGTGTRRRCHFDWWGLTRWCRGYCDWRRRQGCGFGFGHDRRDRAVDKRCHRDRRLRRGGHRDGGWAGVFRIGRAQPEPAIIGRRFVRIMVERKVPEALAGRRLLDVPGGVAGRAIPRGRAGQPGVLRQALPLDLGAHRAGAVNPDPIRRAPAACRGQTRVDAAEILVDLVQRLAARIEIDCEINRAARRLADRPRLAIGGQRVGVAGGIGEVDRVGRMPFPHGDDLHPSGRKALRLGGREGRPTRAGVAIIAGHEIEPGPALQLRGDIAGIGRHVDAM